MELEEAKKLKPGDRVFVEAIVANSNRPKYSDVFGTKVHIICLHQLSRYITILHADYLYLHKEKPVKLVYMNPNTDEARKKIRCIIEKGGSVRSFCKKQGLVYQTIIAWLNGQQNISSKYYTQKLLPKLGKEDQNGN